MAKGTSASWGFDGWLARLFAGLVVGSFFAFIAVRLLLPSDDFSADDQTLRQVQMQNAKIADRFQQHQQQQQQQMGVSKDDLNGLLQIIKQDIVNDVKSEMEKLQDLGEEATLSARKRHKLKKEKEKNRPGREIDEDEFYHPDRKHGELLKEFEKDKKEFEVIHPDGAKPRVPPGPRPKFVPGDDESTIYIAIASFRDKECSGTMLSLYKKASFPGRVHVGLVQQIDPHNILEDCLYQCTPEGSANLTGPVRDEIFEHLCPRIKNKQISDLRIPYTYGKGVMYARHHAQWLVGSHDFALMIDAHSEFEKGWDSLMIANWNEIENEMAVISTYPKNFKDRNDRNTWDMTPTVPQLCRSVFRPNGIPRHQSAIEVKTDVSHISPFWGACYSFSKGHAWRRCTFDPYSYFAFDPEEFSYGIRLWTHGYDLYTPSYNYVYHQYYGDALASKYGKREFYFKTATYKEKAVDRVNARIRYILGGHVTRADNPDLREIAHYGLGDVRSLEDYLEFSHINILERKSPNICNLVWEDKLKLYPLKYVPDLSGVLQGEYREINADVLLNEKNIN